MTPMGTIVRRVKQLKFENGTAQVSVEWHNEQFVSFNIDSPLVKPNWLSDVEIPAHDYVQQGIRFWNAFFNPTEKLQAFNMCHPALQEILNGADEFEKLRTNSIALGPLDGEITPMVDNILKLDEVK
jgi:hypothetical protein